MPASCKALHLPQRAFSACRDCRGWRHQRACALLACRGGSEYRRCASVAAEAERRAAVEVPDAVRHGAPSVHGAVPAPPVGASARRPLLTCAPRAGCRFDGVRALAVPTNPDTAALEGCSFSGLVLEDINGGAVWVGGYSGSTARMQNCTFSGNDADVQLSSMSVLYTDTPVSALTLADLDDVTSIQPLADAPAGEFPTVASPAFVALRRVRPVRLAAAPAPSPWLGTPGATARPLCVFFCSCIW